MDEVQEHFKEICKTDYGRARVREVKKDIFSYLGIDHIKA